MNAEVEVLRPTFHNWPVEKIRAAIEVIRIMESAVEPTRSRRGAGSLPDGAPLPPAGTVISLPAGGLFFVRPVLIGEDDLRRMVERDIPDATIARWRGCSVATVIRRRKALGLLRAPGRKRARVAA